MANVSDAIVSAGPPRIVVGPLGWLRKNLFNTWYNGLLTVLALALILVFLRAAAEWVFTIADWSPVTSNVLLYAVGQYPADQLWRVGVSTLLISTLLGLSWSMWGGIARVLALVFGAGLGIIAVLPLDTAALTPAVRLGLLANTAVLGIGYLLGRTRIVRPRWVLIGWLVSLVVMPVLLRGFEGSELLPIVDSTSWGGLLLNLLLAIGGILASFPVGVLLALGRRSSLPVVRFFSTIYIEAIRGVPLVTILFMASLIIALFLPTDLRLDRVVRAWMGITLFSAAYMAENVRGGLQAIPQGQIEAAKALGLNGFQTTALIVLPQALRNVIPVIAGQFISLFKDTTLVVTIALLDILGIGKSIFEGNIEWKDQQAEVYLFIALVFWVFSYSMSNASRRVEESLGVGKR